MENKIYLMLSQNYTILSKTIQKITKDKYAHASISFNEECTDMYSMGRIYARVPFFGKFKKESIYTGLYAINPKSEMILYEIPVTENQYNNIKRLLTEYGESCKGYNTFGLMLAIFNKKIERKKYYCSELIYKIFSDDSVKLFPKTNDVVKPMDFMKIKNMRKLYEGKIIDYKLNNIMCYNYNEG